MKQFALLAPILIAFGVTAAHADPPRSAAVTCTGGGLTAPPRFGTVPPGVAEYSFSGVCTTRAGQDLGYQATATWTPSESNPANANASEIYRISSLFGPSWSETVILGARCDSDPWLNPAARCSRIGDNMSDELRGLWPDLVTGLFPYSGRAIPYGEQDVLRAQYSRANGSTDRIDDPIERVGLNPQPLPPGGVPDLQVQGQSSVQRAGTNAGIIIVSGRDVDPVVRKRSAAYVRSAEANDEALRGAEQQQELITGQKYLRGMERSLVTIGTQSSEINALATKGPAIARRDPLAMEMRDLQPDGLARRGFDIGMAAAEGQTAPGPGKQRIHDLLSPEEQAGYEAAVDFSLARNKQKIRDGESIGSDGIDRLIRVDQMTSSNANEAAMRGESFDALKAGLRTQPDNSIRVQVRYPVAYGYKDAGGLFDSLPNSCGAFRIDVVGFAYVPGRPLIGIHTQAPMRTSNAMYVCDYLVTDVPLGEPVTLRVAMSNQGAAASEAWQGGSDQPSGGQRRSIVNGERQLTLGGDHPRAIEVFDMVYAGGLSDLISDSVSDAEAVGATRADPPICNNARQAIARNSPAGPGLAAQCRAAGGTLPDLPICTNARRARARNSPAAPGLEASCRAAGGIL